MNFTCDNCQRRYSIADEKVGGKTLRVRCRHCDHLVTVQGPSEVSMDSKPEWLAIIRGKQEGPFDPRQVAGLVRSGDVTAKSYLWRKGMAEWKRGEDLPELQTLFARAIPAAELPFETEAEPTPEPEKTSKRQVGVARSSSPELDPLAALGGGESGELPPGEATRYFIAQAGVDRRNPPWKIALFVAGGIAVPVGILVLLSTFNVVPLSVKTVDASGKEVEQSVFSAGGVSSLGDMLLGKGEKAARAAPARMAAKSANDKGVEKAPVSGANMPKVDPPPTAHPATREELAALYGDTSKTDKGPKLRKDTEQQAPDTSSGGLKPEEIARVVQQSQSAFQSCIEQELRKNPNLRVPRFYLNATVASSGVVKATSISERSVDSSALGECLKLRAKRMTFSHFAGDDLEVQIPLIVGVSM